MGPLSVGALHALLSSRFGSPFARQTLLRIHEQSAGNPFFAIELARVLDPELDPAHRLAVPDTLEGLLRGSIWTAALKTRGSSDAYVVDNKFAANGGTSGWHSHPGPSLVFVVAGTITNYSSDDPSCSPHVYTAGQSFVDPGGDDEHMLRNEDTTVVAETIAVQFIAAGATRRIDEPAPAGCPS